MATPHLHHAAAHVVAGEKGHTLTVEGLHLDLVASLEAARVELATLAGAQARLVEAEETLRAIRHGEVDALVVSTSVPGDQVYTLSSADRPYRIFVENMREGAATLSGTGVVLFANDRLGQLLGCSAAALVARQMSEFVVEGDRARLAAAIGSATVGTTFELQLQRPGEGPDAQVVSVLVGLSRLDIDEEKLTCLTFTDLTAEHRLLNEVRASQQRFEALYRGAPVPAHTWQNGPDGLVLIDLNDAAAELTGQSVADALGTPAGQYYRQDSQLLTHLTRSLTGNVVVELDTLSHTAGGLEHHLHITMVPVPPDLVVVHTQDVTESWLAERALRASEERYRTIVENAQEGISILDARGRFTFANPRTARLLGYDAAVLPGMDGSILLLGASTVLPTEHALPTQHEVTVRRPDGTSIDLLVSTAPIAMPASPDAGTLCMISDVSVLRRADRSRRDQSRENALAFARQRNFSEALQYSLLTDPPRSSGLQIAVRYQPATHDVYVGGDWYDAFVTPSGATEIVIGDVVGHDSQAAADMSQLRGLLRGIAYTTGDSPAELLTRVEAIIEGLALGTMATAIVMRLEKNEVAGQGGVHLRWSNAGHPPAMVVWPDRHVETLVAETADLLLGVDPTSRRSDHVTALTSGCTVLLYTDGLVERRGSGLDEGIALLTTVLRETALLPLEQVCDEVLARLIPGENEDDVALLAARLLPYPSPAA